jgi:hypothetical protein
MEVLLLLGLTVGGVDGVLLELCNQIVNPYRILKSYLFPVSYNYNSHFEMEVLLLLGLAVGGVDGVDVVEHLIYIDLPVAQRVPAFHMKI